MHDHILLHCCCAPCAVGVISALEEANILFHLYFYNPNIHPFEEYEKRKKELFRYASLKHIPCIDADYDVDNWYSFIKSFEEEKEGGLRCDRCFFMRLSQTARFAADNGYPIIATTLAASSRKNIKKIHAAGNAATAPYPSVSFLEYRFRQKNFARVESSLIQEHQIYKQNYCGCHFSLKK